MKILNNVTYRPDMQGSEGLWKLAKEIWRKKVTNIRGRGQVLNVLPLVEHCLQEIPTQAVKNAAAGGRKMIMRARPIIPLDWEEKEPNYPYHLYLQEMAR